MKHITSLLIIPSDEKKDGRTKPILKNNTGKTIIQTVSKSSLTPTNSFIIISVDGTIIVTDPTSMPAPEELDIIPDVITVTHTHSDHIDPEFIEHSDCRKSIATVEKFNVKDIQIFSIASSHRGNIINQKLPNNVIYVFELDGLRIAHMGDIGQEHLTIKQINALGKIDIAFMQFSNPFSGMFDSGKGFTLIEELKPQIIIPTHSNPKSTRKIGKILGKLEILENYYIFDIEDLADNTRKVVWLKNTLNY
ncbi:MAG: MBL fold metallo-hydrolase [Methanobacterium sp.]|uniref:MBL fold metallo-hydrolase n=1 Tax=Methanobacterium sp. TaxID=2164 RepID=UPI003C75A70B